jgi:hypothetical protein
MQGARTQAVGPMLSQDDRHRLGEIERNLRLDDPRFVRRMESGKVRIRLGAILLCCAMWMVAPVLGLIGGLTAVLAAMPVLLVGTALIGPRIRGG